MEDLYESKGSEEASPSPRETEHDGDQEQEGQPILVNKEHAPDAKPGDVLGTLRCVRVHDKELECTLEEQEKEPETESADEEMPGSGGGESLME